MRAGKWMFALAAAAIVCLFVLSVTAQNVEPGKRIKEADTLFEKKNYKEAAAEYEKAIEAGAPGEDLPHIYRQLVSCHLRLRLFDEALEDAEEYIKSTKGTFREARAERFCGNLYLRVPHWGTRAGGEFHRAQHKQGIRLRSWQYDKKHSVKHLQRARKLYKQFDRKKATLPKDVRENWHNERIECIFDLTGAVTRFSIYSNSWYYWYNYWGERDEFRAKTAGEEDFDEYHSHWQLRRKRPIGLRVDKEGNPIFPSRPKDFGQDLSDDEKILYLLHEIRQLDETENSGYAALSYYRQAMLARARFGMDRLNRYGSLYYAGGKRPLQEELKDYNPWELKDSEALTLVGGHIRKVTLPEHYDVMKLLRLVASDYRASGIAAQSQYGLGLYYQTRQQYVPALAEYDKLKEEFPQSNWTDNAQRQIDRIKATQIRLSQTGVQLPEKPAEIQVTYRNADRVWFVARKIDLKGFLEHIRENVIDDNRKRSWQSSLRRWHNYFMRGRARRYSDHWIYKSAADHLGDEVARWSDKIKDDGTHRYSHATLQSPLKDAGAYLVHAYDSPPPKDAAKTSGMNLLTLGDSRAVVVLTDLAIVEKKTSDGKLYYIADAAGGQPVPQANVNVMEVWRERQKRQTKYYKKQHELLTNTEGMTFLTSKKKEQTEFGPDQSVQQMRSRSYAHLLVSAGENRLAWTGMRYYHRYHPSRMRSGRFAYVITDRPVYRPEQTVNFKIWMRQMHNGQLQNTPNHQIGITIYDPKGNKIHNESGRTDQYGGYDGKFTLEEEPRLGVYRIYIHGRRYVGGQNFRVEEYKKPEFEVTVEPGTKHAKLGEKIKAQIKAEYYFGAPVTDATVKYRIFREEYTHRNYPHGYWDWLYGPGYGFAWYDYEWFPWWRKVRGCWAPPHWWWNHYGYSRPNPVRELVKQGQGHIGPDGTLDVEIDTGPALRQHGDLDHRYVIKAEVRDASRRVITGEGSVKVTRQAYYAYVNADGGWYRPGEEMQVTVRCRTPGNEPVQTEGVVTVSRVVLGGPNNAKIKEEELKRWKAETDKRGILKFRLRHERSDQLKIKFQAPDKWGGSVEGYGLVWVCGRDFDGKLYRFNNLELITDKRTYRPGETCHLMINTRHKDSYVIFADQVDNNHLVSWDLLHLPDGHKVLEIPIKKEHEPNFFLEATTVAGTRVHQQAKRICVPPEKKVVKVNVESDKPEYRPGEKAKIHIEAKDLNDNPVNAQVCLSTFDKSVLYIQPEYTPEIKKFFHGNLRHHTLQMRTNLLEQFSAVGSVSRPFQHIHPTPPEWNGIWGTRLGDWRTVQPTKLQELEKQTAGRNVAGRKLGRARTQKAGGALAMEAAADSAAPAPAGIEKARKKGEAEDRSGGGGSGQQFAEAEVRKQFSDTAIWLTDVQTGQDGKASVTVDMPENLTTWKINSWAMTQKTRVGQASTQAITTKNLIVRLQAPRFFLEYDEVVLSANVHNYLGEDKTARVSLNVPEKLLKIMEGSRVERTIEVPADGEKRVDWRVKVLKEGTAKITVKALTDEESDAMQMTFPVLVHGMTKQVAKTGSMRPHEKQATHTITLDVPEKRRPELTHLEIQYAPSLVGAMLDALPYCLDYPYGCTEQTMSRFLPAVLTLKTLQNMGINLEEVRKARGRMDEIRRIEEGENIKIYGSYAENPVFNSKKMNKIIKKGLKRIADMQHGDGGWAWWKRGDSSGYLTSYVTYSLLEAQKADVKVDQNMLRRGLQFLKRWEEGEMRKNWWSPHARHAFACYVLSQKKMRPKIKPGKKDDRPGDGLDRLYKGRDKLNLYGKALLSMALANLDDTKRAETVLQNIMQYREENKDTEMVWFRTPDRGWWYWWNNDIETNAWILRAIIRLQPKSDDAPKLVKWLLENRRNGYYWRSTRDTTLCVAAMSDFVVASGEGQPDYTLTLDLDNGAVTKKVKINKDNFFTYDNKMVVEGVTLGGGKHTLKITKEGPGALYYNSYLRYFTKEEHIGAAGHHLKVKRRYFKLQQIPYEVEVEGAEGQKIMEKRLRYKRVPLDDGDRIESGETIQVELEVSADNNYTYLCFEDMKPAGCEPLRLRSGGKRQEGFYTYMELRDEKVTFFMNSIEQGDHLLRYRLRAEIPGVFHALPAKLYGMYVPELKANSEELVMEIVD